MGGLTEFDGGDWEAPDPGDPDGQAKYAEHDEEWVESKYQVMQDEQDAEDAESGDSVGDGVVSRPGEDEGSAPSVPSSASRATSGDEDYTPQSEESRTAVGRFNQSVEDSGFSGSQEDVESGYYSETLDAGMRTYQELLTDRAERDPGFAAKCNFIQEKLTGFIKSNAPMKTDAEIAAEIVERERRGVAQDLQAGRNPVQSLDTIAKQWGYDPRKAARDGVRNMQRQVHTRAVNQSIATGGLPADELPDNVDQWTDAQVHDYFAAEKASRNPMRA